MAPSLGPLDRGEPGRMGGVHFCSLTALQSSPEGWKWCQGLGEKVDGPPGCALATGSQLVFPSVVYSDFGVSIDHR